MSQLLPEKCGVHLYLPPQNKDFAETLLTLVTASTNETPCIYRSAFLAYSALKKKNSSSFRLDGEFDFQLKIGVDFD